MPSPALPPRLAFDACIVGRVVRDTLREPGAPESERPGGVPVYASGLLAGAGLSLAIVSRHAPAERDLAQSLHPAARLLNRGGTTMRFINAYRDAGEGEDDRLQQVLQPPETIGPEDIAGLSARLWLMGPLLPEDIAVATFTAARRRGGLVAFDLQGFCRAEIDGAVTSARSVLLDRALAEADIVKASAREAEIATGLDDPAAAALALAEAGPAEALVTMGAAGAWLARDGALRRIPARRGPPGGDRTGLGDTYLAAYALMRLGGVDPVAAAEAAAHAAAAKLGLAGPLSEPPADLPHWSRWRAPERALAG